MKEVLNVHIGQAGVQMGSSFWELLCAEHCIMEDGSIYDPQIHHNDKLETYFGINTSSKYIPRSIFVDLEPTVIDEIRNGSVQNLYHPDRLLSGPEDAASNFARGFFTVGKLLLARVNQEMRHMFESSDCVQGIMLFRSLGGGTGAGLTSAIFDGLSEYPKTPKLDIPIYPSPTLSTSTVEPYNAVLAEHFCMEDVDVGLLFDNEALYDACSRFLRVMSLTYPLINRLVSQLCASITASIRFENVLSCDLSVLQTNLVPYPRIHFPLANFAPMLPPCKSNQENVTVASLTRAVFERDNQLMKVDPSYGRFMSCALFYRGNVSPQQVHKALSDIKRDKSIDFVDWCPTGFKVGINSCPPVSVPCSGLAATNMNLAMLTNSSAIGQAWQRLTHKFYLLYAKRSFLHWFVGEGMEECEFTEALYNISTLVKDYEEVSADTLRGDDADEYGKNPESTKASNTIKSDVGLKGSTVRGSGLNSDPRMSRSSRPVSRTSRPASRAEEQRQSHLTQSPGRPSANVADNHKISRVSDESRRSTTVDNEEQRQLRLTNSARQSTNLPEELRPTAMLIDDPQPVSRVSSMNQSVRPSRVEDPRVSSISNVVEGGYESTKPPRPDEASRASRHSEADPIKRSSRISNMNDEEKRMSTSVEQRDPNINDNSISNPGIPIDSRDFDQPIEKSMSRSSRKGSKNESSFTPLPKVPTYEEGPPTLKISSKQSQSSRKEDDDVQQSISARKSKISNDEEPVPRKSQESSKSIRQTQRQAEEDRLRINLEKEMVATMPENTQLIIKENVEEYEEEEIYY